MSVLTHVLWDWNGTLLDDLDAAIDAMNGVLAANGLPLLDRARYRSVFGFPVQDYYGRLGFGPEHGTFEDWARAFLDAYDRGAQGIPIRREARLRACDCAVLETLEDLYTADTPVRAYLAQAS